MEQCPSLKVHDGEAGPEPDTGNGAEGTIQGTTSVCLCIEGTRLGWAQSQQVAKREHRHWCKTKGNQFEKDFSLILLRCLQLMPPSPNDIKMESQGPSFPPHPTPPLTPSPFPSPQLRSFNRATAPSCGQISTFPRSQASRQPSVSNSDQFLIPQAGSSCDGYENLGKSEEERSIQNNKNSWQQYRSPTYLGQPMFAQQRLAMSGFLVINKTQPCRYYPSLCGAYRPA